MLVLTMDTSPQGEFTELFRMIEQAVFKLKSHENLYRKKRLTLSFPLQTDHRGGGARKVRNVLMYLLQPFPKVQKTAKSSLGQEWASF